ncbi:CinA family protein [Nonomuraea sp. CA-218870]|uniref:CinA family protein n=1 Tax=Nonomuraea sp. CA-218870 TaxID=3239998 RepID=UPI003D93AE99
MGGVKSSGRTETAASPGGIRTGAGAVTAASAGSVETAEGAVMAGSAGSDERAESLESMEGAGGTAGAGRPSGAVQVLETLARREATLAVAESLTGGLIGATITAVPGSSRVFRGGVISYATDLKHGLLGVPDDLLRREGAVHPEVAAAMAAGAARLCEATYGLAVTGVAGPEPQDGQPVGTVFAAVSGPGGRSWGRRLSLQGSRERIRVETVDEAIDLLASVLMSSKGEHFG